jgi:hypothetical protein
MLAAFTVVVLGACSNDSGSSSGSGPETTSAATPAPTKPVTASTAEAVSPTTATPAPSTTVTTTGSVATTDTTSDTTVVAASSAIDLSTVTVTPMPAGGVPQASATVARSGTGEPPTLVATYVETEFLLSGAAATYAGSVLETPTVATEGNEYTTRIVVRRPASDADFSGRVMIEPFNTSGGPDSAALWGSLHPLLQANGDAWIGVTERAAGAAGLTEFDAARYADIDLPVNDYAWDILRQLGGLVKEGNTASPLAELDVQHLYMGGYSQSAVETGAFLSAFHAITRMTDDSPIYDGYLPVARSASLTKLQSGDAALPGFEFAAAAPADVPVINPETQTDVEGFLYEADGVVVYENPGGATVRRDDSDSPDDLYRLYELSGSPHVPRVPDCDGEGSSFPTHLFIQAAADLLFDWAENGVVPPRAERIDMEVLDVVSIARVDAVGNPVGGVRSPFLDVPLTQFEVHGGPGILCKLGGNETPLPADVLADKYDSVDSYLREFTASLDAVIETGFLLEQQRDAIIADATALAMELLT